MRSEMKCDDAFEAMSAGLDGELGDTERPRLRHHLSGCDRCRARDAELRAVHRQMRAAVRVSLVRPPERLRLRVQRDCTPVAPRFSPFAFGIALTGAGALGALLALAFRSPAAPRPGAELASPEQPRPPGGTAPVPPPRAEASRVETVFTGQAESLAPPHAAAPKPLPGQPAVATSGGALAAATAGSPAAPASSRPAAAAAPGCAPPAPPVLVQLEAPPQPVAPGSPAVQATLGSCGLEPAVVTALIGQTIQLRNAGRAGRQIQIDQEAAAGAAFAEGAHERLDGGASMQRTFVRPGLYPVWCDGGGQPCGYLAVADHPRYAVAEAAGPAAALDVRFTAPPRPGARPVVVFQPRRRALLSSLTLDDRGAGQLRLDPTEGAAPAVALALNDCRVVRDRQSPVAHACARGGIKEAKKAMKNLVKRARDRGLKFQCDTCHRNEQDWQLSDDARANFSSMLAAAGT